MDINTTFQLEKDNKQYTVVAHTRVLDLYFKEDISLYRNDKFNWKGSSPRECRF